VMREVLRLIHSEEFPNGSAGRSRQFMHSVRFASTPKPSPSSWALNPSR
jgi:hypothetical protein